MTAPISLSMHRVMAHLSDGESRTGHDLGASSVLLDHLHRAGMIGTDDVGHMMDRHWHLLPRGFKALEATQ